MKKLVNEEFRRMQKLAGLINENEEKINESPSEEKILDDILGSLEEGMFSNVLDKVKKYAKGGLITISILATLLGSTQLTTSQKDEVKNVVKTEMSTTADDMTVGFQLLSFYKAHQNDKSMSSWSKQNPSSSLISDIKNIVDNKLEKNKDMLEMLGNIHKGEAQSFLNSYRTFHMK